MVPAVLLLAASIAEGQSFPPARGRPLIGLAPSEATKFSAGEAAFNTTMTAGQGLGPIMNSDRCNECHLNGGAHIGLSVGGVTRFGRSDPVTGVFSPMNPHGGSLLQTRTNSTNPQCQEQLPSQRGINPPENVVTRRRARPVWGSGLIEAIPDSAIIQNSLSGSGGRVNMVPDPQNPSGPQLVGRFGWKAQAARVRDFTADALQGEMGITNAIFPAENTPFGPNGNTAWLASCDTVPDPEDRPDANGFTLVDKMTDYQTLLAPPPKWPPVYSGGGFSNGEQIFSQIGCAVCHVPSYTTSATAPSPALRNKTIYPYSDFLLHNMGTAGDGIAQDGAGPNEIRTPPLWGLYLRYGLWHDARTWDIANAVALHGASGASAPAVAAANAYANLSFSDQQAVDGFLRSLGRRPLDHNGDDVVDRQDLIPPWPCYPSSPGPNDICSQYDVDQNRIIDAIDINAFIAEYTGPQIDCNCNGINDILDVTVGQMADLNRDALPDSCRHTLMLAPPISTTNSLGQRVLEFQVTGTSPTSLLAGEAVYYYASLSPIGDGPSLQAFGASCTKLPLPLSLGEATAIRDPLYLTIKSTFRFTLPANVPHIPVSVQAFVMRQGLQIFLSNPVEFGL